MLPCTNTRSEDAALEGQGFKPPCLSTPILGVELSSSSIMASASRDFPTVPRTQPGTPARKLVSDAADGVTGRRFLAVHWDPSLPPEEAAEKAGAPVAWTGIATMPIEPPRRS